MIFQLCFVAFLIWSWWLFSQPLDDALIRDGVLRLDHCSRKQQSQIWLEALHQLHFPPPSRTRLAKYIAKRESVLYKIKGHIEIGDLVSQKALVPHLDHLITSLQTYDQNMLRLEATHRTTRASIQALHPSFHETFTFLVQYADQAPTTRGQGYKHIDHKHKLTTYLRCTKLYISTSTQSVINSLLILFIDTLSELTTFPHPPQGPPTSIRENPLFKAVIDDADDKNILRIPCKVLTKLGLDASHALHAALVHDLARLAQWQLIIEDAYLTMRHELVEIDDCLHDLVEEVGTLDVENLRGKSKGISQLIDRLGELAEIEVGSPVTV